LVGFGTVGTGVARLISEGGEAIASKMGVRLELACVVDVDTQRPRPSLPDGVLTSDLNRLLGDPGISIGIELVGGTTVARDIQLRMLRAGKDVVTANKALLATHGGELYQVARENGRCIAFEASCAGGIPIIAALRTGLAANTITSMYGIVNGTCNYILSSMTAKDEAFSASQAGPEARLCRGRSDAGHLRRRQRPQAGDPRRDGVRVRNRDGRHLHRGPRRDRPGRHPLRAGDGLSPEAARHRTKERRRPDFAAGPSVVHRHPRWPRWMARSTPSASSAMPSARRSITRGMTPTASAGRDIIDVA
jgi:hypothetical protein